MNQKVDRPLGPRYKPKPKKRLGKSLPGRIIYTMPPKESNVDNQRR